MALVGLKLKAKRMQDEKSFPNPYLDELVCNSPGKLGAEIPPVLVDTLKGVIGSSLPLIDREYLGVSSRADQSVYTGSTGIALLHYHLATSLFKDNPTESSKHLLLSADLLQPSLSRLDTHTVTFLCGASGPLAVAATVYAKLGKAVNSKQCIDILRDLYIKNKPSFPQKASSIEDHVVAELVDIILSSGEQGQEDHIPSPLMYTWHHKHYMGAAHGLAGILTLLLQVPIESLKPRIHALVRPCVDFLLAIRLASGNLPSSLENGDDDRLVHWCHGAPGAVHLFALAYKVFGSSTYLDAAVGCGEVVWNRGLLRKGYGLCHGVAGNGYTFLQLYRVTGQPHYLQRAVRFAEWCLSSSERQCRLPDSPHSLFEGLAGTLYYYSDICSGPDKATFPALELPAV